MKAQPTISLIPPVVERTETVYTYTPANNGATPMWCYGSTCIARLGDDVFVSGLETLPDVEPYNNVRWLLFRNRADGWELAQKDENGRTREPCPLGVYADGRLWLSANPLIGWSLRGKWRHPTQPQMICFAASDPGAPGQAFLPAWNGAPLFGQHSYRGLATDGVHGEALLLNIHEHEAQYWTFMDRHGNWPARGRLVFPWGAEYEKPEPIRLCYPIVALSDRQALVVAVSDIVEPVAAWRAAKFAQTQREWDYVFRRIYYAWTPDIVRQPFSGWTELANRDATAGRTVALDASLASGGVAHLLWLDQSCDPGLRDAFFPNEMLSVSLMYGIVRGGKVLSRHTLMRWNEGSVDALPLWGRLYATPDGRLWALVSSKLGRFPEREDGEILSHRLIELRSDGGVQEVATLNLGRAFRSHFMLACERGGSAPSRVMDVLGMDEQTVQYARIRLY